ncbi:FixH family protein [Aquabacter cavernae]|uniref:FixH family protein n=1 Tax=Aquabacter cavernae TaxID=2496029 RepID=UPI000F8EEC48|nr:FixH family protein [Aquabacter cavernae]
MPGTLESGRPREITGRFVLVCILAFFATIIAVNVVMARFAVTTFGGVETASSYKAGLAFRGEEMAAEQQAERHWNVVAEFQDLGGGGRIVTLIARDNAGRPLSGLIAATRLSHPTDARRDVTTELKDLGDGRYGASLDAPAGQWDLVIDLSQGDQRLFRSKNRMQLR